MYLPLFWIEQRSKITLYGRIRINRLINIIKTRNGVGLCFIWIRDIFKFKSQKRIEKRAVPWYKNLNHKLGIEHGKHGRKTMERPIKWRKEKATLFEKKNCSWPFWKSTRSHKSSSIRASRIFAKRWDRNRNDASFSVEPYFGLKCLINNYPLQKKQQKAFIYAGLSDYRSTSEPCGLNVDRFSLLQSGFSALSFWTPFWKNGQFGKENE